MKNALCNVRSAWALSINFLARDDARTTGLVGLATATVCFLVAIYFLWPLDIRVIDKYPTDAISFTLASKIISLGERFHHEHFVALGGFDYWVVHIGEVLFGAGAPAINFYIISTTFLCVLFLFVVSLNRLSIAPAAVLLAATVLMMLTPGNIGNPMQPSVAMHYNKIAFALLAGVFIVAYCPNKSADWRIDALLIGGMLLILFYSKLPHFLIAWFGAFVAAATSVRAGRARDFYAITMIGLCVALFLMPANWAYLRDLYLSGLQADSANLSVVQLAKLLANNWDAVYAPAAALLVLFATGERRPIEATAIWVIVVGGGFAAMSQNLQFQVIPSMLAFSVIAFQRVVSNSDQAIRVSKISAAGLALLLTPAATAFDALGGFANYKGLASRVGGHWVAYPDGPLKGYVVNVQNTVLGGVEADIYVQNPSAYFTSVRRGAELVVASGVPAPTVFTPDQVNGPAAFGDLRPARNWFFWTAGTPARLPGEPVVPLADMILIPHAPTVTDIRDMAIGQFQAAIEDNYLLFDSQDQWTLCIARRRWAEVKTDIPPQEALSCPVAAILAE